MLGAASCDEAESTDEAAVNRTLGTPGSGGDGSQRGDQGASGTSTGSSPQPKSSEVTPQQAYPQGGSQQTGSGTAQ